MTDIVLEDRSLSKDATMVRHNLHDAKYSRLTCLLRLGALRDWLNSILPGMPLSEPSWAAQPRSLVVAAIEGAPR